MEVKVMDNFIKKQMLDFTRLKDYTKKPKIFEKGASSLWNDPHISKNMLQAHLNPDTDAASRRAPIINSTIAWIADNYLTQKSDILDLGCGPGLYAKNLSQLGHNVIGIDFSERSIEYAKKDAKKNNLAIQYLYQNYLEIDYENKFDLIILIYCDFGVLNDEERQTLLTKAYKALRPSGVLIFDIFNEKYCPPCVRSWTIEEHGFWSEHSYMVVSETFHYSNDNTYLDQHTVIMENGNINVYRNWNRFYSKNDINTLLAPFKFSSYSCYDNMIPNSNFTSSDVTFVVAKK